MIEENRNTDTVRLALHQGFTLLQEEEISTYLEQLQEMKPLVLAVEKSTDRPGLWFVRLEGDHRGVFSIWFTLRQRNLHFETYVLPAPPQHQEVIFEMLLRRNQKLIGMSFGIGDEDAIYLRGACPIAWINQEIIDCLVGSIFTSVEQAFPLLAKYAFGTRV